ncbi:hypothetical protein [Acinetobacter sp. Marseille-Q1618]|uniref:hypothetical protein n=1 Tax=Acinetobacter sp. Marseille-Q1618 TaxID=2697502 RepID=UPI0020C49640|nr:hypothetical protein [Acinetobacter sp. Marseille-Q1618]
MKIKSLCLLISMFLMACTQEILITPKVLPNAVVGQYYDTKIEIEKVTLIDGLYFDSTIAKNSGLSISHVGVVPYSDHTIIIRGIPTQTGTYHIVLEGVTRDAYGGNIHFRKEYDLVVVK